MDRKKEMGANRQMHRGTTLHEEATGIKHEDASCILKTQHLRRLAEWASREARLSPLAAFLGWKFASEAEASRIPLEPSAVLCERCETLLQPGINCTIRIENSEKSRRSCQNKVIYKCHFCSQKNQAWVVSKSGNKRKGGFSTSATVGGNPEVAASGNMTTNLRKRRRRGQMSLRKIVENELKEMSITNFAIPFWL